jgi:tRNA-modifying protein YgfZ
VTGEYLALRDGAGLVAGAHDLVWVRGPDAVSFLDGLISQDVAGMAGGAVARALLLGPRGKLQATLWVLRGDEEVGLVCDAGRAAVVAADLGRYRIRVRAEVVTEERPLLELWGPDAAAVAVAAGVPDPGDGWVGGAVVVARLPFAAASLERLVVAGADRAALVAAGAVPAGRVAVDTVRIEAGEPVTGVDVDEGTIPQEGGLVEGAVSFTKGCYLGQELVARIDSRGHVNRRLRGLRLRSNVIPPVPAAVLADGREVGTVTSIGESLRLRAPVAMALLRREVGPGDTVTVGWEGGSVEAVVDVLPLDPDLRGTLPPASHSSNDPAS